ncbi:MAG: acyl-CoA thioesterase II [Candidatus Pelagadaptatus aseana]|uniref:acyl-CoA thioesterase n=1 Tax=Candidatus Pelagadaptatus aseana TaxID=3120508 RepID=UPI0039B222FC
MKLATEKLYASLKPEQLDPYLFRSPAADSPLPNLFGGQVMAQSLNAAIQTVPEDRMMHSMHAYFLRPGKPNTPIIFDVDPIRDGGSFTTRRVVAKQNGKAIFNTSISFMAEEEGFEHQMDMPDVPAPDSLPTDEERKAAFQKANPDFKGLPNVDKFNVFEIRTNGKLLMEAAGEKRDPQLGFWFKTVEPLANDPIIHQTLLAYASDFRLMGTSLLPHGVNFYTTNMQAASLDHALWIHRDFKADEWIYYDISGPNAQGGRGLNFGRFFSHDGTLIASTAQEGLIRLR